MSELNRRLPWDARFMKDAYEWSWQSKDPRTKIGAIIVHWDTKVPVINAYNGLARGVNDSIPERWIKPLKTEWTSHAERNAIFLSARYGKATEGTTMFTQGLPCMGCCDAIINSGIKEVVIHNQWLEHEKRINEKLWKERFNNSARKLNEAGVIYRIFDGILGVEGLVDGEIVKV
jgi:dCMP deaminase